MWKRSLVLATLLAMSVAIPGAASASPEWVDQTLKRLTLRETVAQLVMPWLPGGSPVPGSAEWRRARRLVREDRVGGVIVGKGRAFETAAWLNELQRLSDLPLLVSADLEWGAGTRLQGATVLPVNMALAAAGDASYAYQAGRITAHEARAAGIHMAFAPVADVNVNPANPVINTRSYGADPDAVATRVGAFVRGAEEEGILTAAKHFPGHGDTNLDSHLGLPRLAVSRSRLDRVELVPFRAAIRAGVPAIMTAHLAVPALDPQRSNRPATLSSAILTQLLRERLGFDGLIITDALIMDGVREGRDAGRMAIDAIHAGADILLMPPNAGDAIDAVVEAVESGELTRERIDASARRVLEAKARVGLPERRITDLRNLLHVLGAGDHKRWAQRAAERSLTLVRHDAQSLPLSIDRGLVPKILTVTYADSRRRTINEVFDETLAESGGYVESVRLWRRSSRSDLARVERMARSADIVIFCSYARAAPWKGRLGLPDRVADTARRLSRDGAIVVNFGDPYLLKQLPQARTYLLAWSDADVAQRAAARALVGDAEITGELPIPLPPNYTLGDGIALPAIVDRGSAVEADVAETHPPEEY